MRKKKPEPTTAEKIVTSLYNSEYALKNIEYQLVRLVNLQKINTSILNNLAGITNQNLVQNKDWSAKKQKEIDNI